MLFDKKTPNALIENLKNLSRVIKKYDIFEQN